MKKVHVYTDGGSRGNPGPSGIGVFICEPNGTMIKEVKKFLGHGTNNVAEYTAVLIALHTLHTLYGAKTHEIHVEVRMDSELVQRQLTGVYRVKDATLKTIFEKIMHYKTLHFPHISFVHVRREQNKEADRLANEAMDKKS